MRIGVDASNIRAGGGLTHLGALLREAEPAAFGIERVLVWGARATLAALPERPWLEPVHEPWLERPLPWRVLWQQAVLPAALRRRGCAALFSPGGTLPWRPGAPGIVLSQNLLPFEPAEGARFPVGSPPWLKLKLLRLAQARSARRAAAIAFLSRYAEAAVLGAVGPIPAPAYIIPHGVDEEFFFEPRPQRSPAEFSAERPFRFLYVSALYPYKHHVEVARAARRLRLDGLPVTVDLVGPAGAAALSALASELGPWARWRGAVPHAALPEVYRGADAFVFASSCENLPNILLEAMAAGLPIACSGRGPMPEALGDGGIYFDPYDEEDAAAAMKALFLDAGLRARAAAAAFRRARRHSWRVCAQRTLWMIAEAGCR